MTRSLADSSNPASLAHRFRSKRDVGLRDFLLASRGDVTGTCRIADLGGGAAYWERVGMDWLEEHDFEVVCVNYDESELTRDSARRGPLSFVVGDACDMADHADNSFDVVHSNSVIEHVGGWDRVSAFAREVRRLAPAYYVQTPNFWFPIDPHFYRVPFIHWLPASARARVHMAVKAGWGERAGDLDHAMGQAMSNAMLSSGQMRHLFPDAHIRYERLALLRKSIIAIRHGTATGPDNKKNHA